MSHFIHTEDDALDASFCRHLIARFEHTDAPRREGETGAGVDREKKQSWDITLDAHRAWDADRTEILKQLSVPLRRYMEELPFLLIGAMSPMVRHPNTDEPVTLTSDNFDDVGRPYAGALMNRLYRPGTINLQKYPVGVGGYPHWHSEIYPQANGTDALHRVLFWICYLNDVDEGGETEFAHQGVKVQPRAGRLLIAPAGFTHTHRGNVPRSGDKYILASWTLFRAGGTFETERPRSS